MWFGERVVRTAGADRGEMLQIGDGPDRLRAKVMQVLERAEAHPDPRPVADYGDQAKGLFPLRGEQQHIDFGIKRVDVFLVKARMHPPVALHLGDIRIGPPGLIQTGIHQKPRETPLI